MNCPKCNKPTIESIKSVNVPWNEVYRRKRCKTCGHIFYTAEIEVEPNKRFRREWALYGPKADKWR